MSTFSAPWAGTPTERFEYCVRNGLESIERLEVLTSFLVQTKKGQLFDTSLAKLEGEEPFTVKLAFAKDQRKLLLEIFLEKQVYKDRASTLVARFDQHNDSFTYHYVNDFGGDEEPVSARELLELAEGLPEK